MTQAWLTQNDVMNYRRIAKGRVTGDAWARTEQEIINAGREGRILGSMDVAGR